MIPTAPRPNAAPATIGLVRSMLKTTIPARAATTIVTTPLTEAGANSLAVATKPTITGIRAIFSGVSSTKTIHLLYQILRFNIFLIQAISSLNNLSRVQGSIVIGGKVVVELEELDVELVVEVV